MAKTTKPPRVIVTLKLPTPVLALLALAKAIQAAMAANPGIFKSPVPPLAQLASDLAALDTAQQTALTRVKGSVEIRDAKREVVTSDLHALRAYVQTVVDGDPANGASIATAAGMAVRAPLVRAKQALTLKPTTISGSVAVTARVTAARSSHEWEYSTDGGKTYVALAPTLQAKTTITGLVPGSTVLVRHRAVTKTGPDDWSQPVSQTVV
jgi:hypothetical protein